MLFFFSLFILQVNRPPCRNYFTEKIIRNKIKAGVNIQCFPTSYMDFPRFSQFLFVVIWNSESKKKLNEN